VRLVDAVSLRSRRKKLRLLLEELQPTAETTVLDVGADELGFGEGDGCGTLNFLEEMYPWPERITALGLHEGRLHLVLRNPEDSDTVQVAALNTPQMLAGVTPSSTAAVRRASTKASKASKAPTTPTETRPAVVRSGREPKPVVRIIREAKVTEQTAPKDSAQ